MTRLDGPAKGIREFRITVMDVVPIVFEEAPFLHGDIPSSLHHPRLVWMGRDAGHLHSAALQMKPGSRAASLPPSLSVANSYLSRENRGVGIFASDGGPAYAVQP